MEEKMPNAAKCPTVSLAYSDLHLLDETNALNV